MSTNLNSLLSLQSPFLPNIIYVTQFSTKKIFIPTYSRDLVKDVANTFENAIIEQEKLLFKSIVALPQVSNLNEGPTKTWAPTIIQKL